MLSFSDVFREGIGQMNETKKKHAVICILFTLVYSVTFFYQLILLVMTITEGFELGSIDVLYVVLPFITFSSTVMIWISYIRNGERLPWFWLLLPLISNGLAYSYLFILPSI